MLFHKSMRLQIQIRMQTEKGPFIALGSHCFKIPPKQHLHFLTWIADGIIMVEFWINRVYECLIVFKHTQRHKMFKLLSAYLCNGFIAACFFSKIGLSQPQMQQSHLFSQFLILIVDIVYRDNCTFLGTIWRPTVSFHTGVRKAETSQLQTENSHHLVRYWNGSILYAC